MYQPQRHNTLARYKQIQARYYELYEVQRIRRDDAKKMVEREYFLERRTLNRILNFVPATPVLQPLPLFEGF